VVKVSAERELWCSLIPISCHSFCVANTASPSTVLRHAAESCWSAVQCTVFVGDGHFCVWRQCASPMGALRHLVTDRHSPHNHRSFPANAVSFSSPFQVERQRRLMTQWHAILKTTLARQSSNRNVRILVSFKLKCGIRYLSVITQNIYKAIEQMLTKKQFSNLSVG